MNNNVIPLNSFKSSQTIEKKRRAKTIPDIIKANNSPNDKIKLRCKKLSNGSYSLYLDLRRDGKKEYYFLKTYITDIKKDSDKIDYTIEFRNKKQNEFFQNEHGFRLKNEYLKIDFIKYFKNLAYNRQRPDKSWQNTYKHLKQFSKEKPVLLKHVDEKFCEQFRDYLIISLGSKNTGHTYFAKLKASLNQAVKDNLISKNPAQFLHISKEDTHREFLTLRELKKLKNTPCPDEQTKRAFLFSCFTGLRISDIEKLTFDDMQNGYLIFRQKKTRGYERLKLNKNAVDIISQQLKDNKREGKVFQLVTAKHALNHLSDWAKSAKINKNVTWHTGRHTFATMALTYGVDIYTVSKLLGHRELRTTQIYAKLIDKKKDEGIDKLPNL